jgi:hypothetical protein
VANIILEIQGFSKNMIQSWETDSQEGFVAFEFYMETDHCYFLILLSRARVFLKRCSTLERFSLKTHTALLYAY